MFRKFLAAAVALVSVASLTSCAPAPSFASVEEFYTQPLKVTSCASDFKCASVAAPVDWNDPSKGSIQLAVTFKDVPTAKDFLFVNPGGPGASGVNYVQENYEGLGTEKLRENYKIVGFDPRGTKGSDPVVCYDAKETDSFLYEDTGFEIGSDADLEASRKAVADFGLACKENSGPSLAYVDTVSAAKDMELLRNVFRQDKLNYLGFSYGTFLGTTYAALFPDKVGRLVLDGAIDPNVPDEQQSINQLKGFDLALSNYLSYCLESDPECPFSGTVDSSLKRISLFLRGLETNPLSTNDGDRKLTIAAGTTGIYLTLYSNDYWSYLTQAFNEAFDSGDGSTFLKLADFYNSRNEDGSYSSNELEANIAINCLDGRSGASDAARKAQNQRLIEASPTFGRYWQNGALLCDAWPYPLAKRPDSYAANGAPTIMVIGTTGDPATPYQQSVSLAHDVLAKGFLVTFDGEGHTAYGRSNDCIANVVDDFLIDGVLPETEPTC